MDILILVLVATLLLAVFFFGRAMRGRILTRLSDNAYFGAFFAFFAALIAGGGWLYYINEYAGVAWFGFWIGFLWFTGRLKKK